MKAARSWCRPSAAMLAVCGALGAGVGRQSRHRSAARQRAEDLAQAASERFDDFLRPQRIAQAQTGKARRPKDTANDDPWSFATRWIEHSNREYQQLMRRLSQAGEPAKPAQQPATAPRSRRRLR